MTDPDVRAALCDGELEVKGRIMPASNLTFLADVVRDGTRLPCVYKPTAGERPLWDFPDGTLSGREVAAYHVSEAMGWDVVPLTVLRDGPAGPGMAQLWCEPDPTQDPVDVVPAGTTPTGYLHVLEATDERDRPVALVHEDSRSLRRMAVFDAVVNNADRKGGHVLAMPDGHRYGVDHGVSFHAEAKLRTVLWGWAGAPLDDDDRTGIRRVLAGLEDDTSPLARTLAEHLTPREVVAVLALPQAALLGDDAAAVRAVAGDPLAGFLAATRADAGARPLPG